MDGSNQSVEMPNRLLKNQRLFLSGELMISAKYCPVLVEKFGLLPGNREFSGGFEGCIKVLAFFLNKNFIFPLKKKTNSLTCNKYYNRCINLSFVVAVTVVVSGITVERIIIYADL